MKTKASSKVKKKSPPGPHPLHIAKQFQQQLEAGTVNKAELARRHGMSRARVTQIMNLLKLPWRIQTELVKMPPDEQEYFSERMLREIVKLQYASQQMEAFEKLKSKYNG